MGLERARPWALRMLLHSIIILPVLLGIRTEKKFSSSISSSNHIKFATVLKWAWISWILSIKRQNWTSITLTEEVFRTHVLASSYVFTVVSPQWEKVCLSSNSIWNINGKLFHWKKTKQLATNDSARKKYSVCSWLSLVRVHFSTDEVSFPFHVVLPHSTKHK